MGWRGRPTDRGCYSAGAAENTVYEFCLGEGRAERSRTHHVGPPERRTGGELLNAGFIGGLAIAPDGQALYAIHVFGQAVSAIDLQTRPRDQKK